MSSLTKEQYKQLCEIETTFLSNIINILEKKTKDVTSVKLKFETIHFHLTNNNDERVKIETSKLIDGESASALSHLFNDIEYEHKKYKIEIQKIISNK